MAYRGRGKVADKMRQRDRILDLPDTLHLAGRQQLDLSTRPPEYNLALWLSWFGGRDDGSASELQVLRWRSACRPAPCSPRTTRRRSSRRPPRRRSLRCRALPRRGRCASLFRRPCRRRLINRRQRASRSTRNASSASTRAMRPTGSGNRTSEPMHHRQRSGVTSARTARSTCTFISICKEG